MVQDMDYAIIATGGKQYRVRPGDSIEVEKLPGEVGDTVSIPDTLLISVKGKVTIGAPVVKTAEVQAEIASQGRSDKVTVFKYHSKTRSRIKRGHRQAYTELTIKSVSLGRQRRLSGKKSE